MSAHVVVVGGIGGLTTAIALRRVNLEPAVFERRERFEELQHGTGLTLWSNAIKALRQLGIGDQIEAAGLELEAFEQRSWRGGRLASWPIGQLARRTGAPSINLTRAALHRVLKGELGDGVVTLGAACIGVEQTGDEVIARFADGREVRSDVLVGADGINSVVRASLFGREEPRYAGYTAWRGLVAFEDPLAPRQLFVQIWGPGSRFAYYHVGGGQLYWIAVANARAREPGDPEGAKHELLRRFAGWTNPVEAILAATDEAAIQRMDIEDR